MSGKSRTFLGVLYPDSESYDCSAVLERLSCLFDEWAYIVHDSDSDENGELKKAHIHWVGRLENATSLLAIADSKHLGVNPNSIEYCKNFKFAVRYLIHKDSPDKFQYQQDSIKSNFDVVPFFRDKYDEEASVRKIRAYLMDSRRCKVFSTRCQNTCIGTRTPVHIRPGKASALINDNTIRRYPIIRNINCRSAAR